jgi:mitochondrial-processing peptidase subunit alpha
MVYGSSVHRSGLKLYRDAEALGGSTVSNAGREIFSFTGSALRENISGVAGIMAESLGSPAFYSYEVDEAKATVSEHIAEKLSNPSILLMENLHAAAFGSTTPLGHSLYGTAGSFSDIDSDVLRHFLGATINSSNVVLVGTNIDKAHLNEIAEQYFASLPSSSGGVKDVPSAYVGGELLERVEDNAGGLAHVALGFQVPGLAASAKSNAALSVLQALLGDGMAAGAYVPGPHKTTRIGRSVHTESHSFIRSISAFSTQYSDAGLFGIYGCAADHESGRLVDAAVGFLKDAASVGATAHELERAKTAYKLSVSASLDSSNGSRSHAGRSSLLQGSVATVKDLHAAADSLTAADLQNVAKAALASKPAFSAIGSLSSLPKYDRLVSMLA